MLFFQKPVFLLALFGVVSASTDRDSLPLFASGDVLDITFEVPMQTIISKAERKPEVNGLLHYTEDDGQAVTLQIEMNTRYAEPSESLRIHSVRQRVYRGRCSNLDQLDATLTIFNKRRAAIEAALLPAALEGKHRKRAARYITEFYETINDPEKLQKNIVDKCIG